MVVLLAFALTAAVGGAQATAPTVLYPRLVDGSNQAGWWKPIAEHDGSVYIAFNAWGGPGPTEGGGSADTHTVFVAKRDPTGVWTEACLRDAAGRCIVYPDDVGHNQPSIAVDGDGYIHAFVAMHNTNWRYWRSAQPRSVDSMVDRSAMMPDQGGRYTYPVAARAANGDVYTIIRALPVGRLYRWDNATDTWSRVATFASAAGYVVYPDDVFVDASGGVNIAWEWAYSKPDGLRHLGSYLRYSPAANRFSNAAGAEVTVPATTASPVVYQPIEGAEQATDRESPNKPPGLQTAKVSVDPATGRPLIAYRYRATAGGGWQVRLAQWDGAAWRREVVHPAPHSSYAAVGISTSNRLRVYYARYSADALRHQAFVATRQADGTWAEESLLPTAAIERLAVVQRGATDHLYLVAPTANQLFYGAR